MMLKRRILVFLSVLFLSRTMSAQNVSVSANLLDGANLGTIGVEASYAVGRHWTAGAGIKYNPFTYNAGTMAELYNRQRTLSARTRYWPWYVYSGWWMGASLQGQEYSVGDMQSSYSEDGWRMGGGFSAGYSLMLLKYLNMDFGLGLWAGRESYESYACPSCGRKTGEGVRTFLRPDNILLSLTFIF